VKVEEAEWCPCFPELVALGVEVIFALSVMEAVLFQVSVGMAVAFAESVGEDEYQSVVEGCSPPC